MGQPTDYTKGKKVLGKKFVKRIGITQGKSASPMIFNIVVDAVVRAVLVEVCGPQEAQHGMVWDTGEPNLVFCAYDGWKAGRDHIWLQDALTAMVEIFKRVGLDANLEKIKPLVCSPRYT